MPREHATVGRPRGIPRVVGAPDTTRGGPEPSSGATAITQASSVSSTKATRVPSGDTAGAPEATRERRRRPLPATPSRATTRRAPSPSTTIEPLGIDPGPTPPRVPTHGPHRSRRPSTSGPRRRRRPPPRPGPCHRATSVAPRPPVNTRGGYRRWRWANPGHVACPLHVARTPCRRARLPSPEAEPLRIALLDLPGQPALRRPGRLQPPPRPASSPSSGTRSRCSPASPGPSSTTRVAAREGRRASTSTAPRTRSGCRGRTSSATAIDVAGVRASCARPASPSRTRSACGSARLLQRPPRRLRPRARQPVPRHAACSG